MTLRNVEINRCQVNPVLLPSLLTIGIWKNLEEHYRDQEKKFSSRNIYQSKPTEKDLG